MKKRMPIGVEDFKEVREQYYLVDKTQFLQQLIDDHSKVTLLTRPRRFGKTLTMSMVEYFFSIDKRESSQNLFQRLYIEQANPSYMHYQGQYPVIFLSLKEIKNLTWSSMLDNWRVFLRKLYLQYQYLQTSDRVDKAMQDDYCRIIERKATLNELANALARLMDMLQCHYGKKVIVLIDEYDVPVQQAWEQGFYDECINFVKQFLGNALKTNENLEFAVLTGVLRIAKESIFSDLNNFDVYSVLSETYSDVIGFTPSEVEQLAYDIGEEKALPQIKEWYDGYRFGETEIYNPWSVLNYFKRKKLGDYWVNTSGNTILYNLLQLRMKQQEMDLLALLQGKTVTTILCEDVGYQDIGSNQDALYTMLLATGYLTLMNAKDIPGGTLCELALPNREVRNIYQREILERMRSHMNLSAVYMTMHHLVDGNVDAFSQGLTEYISQIVSTYDTANKESFYPGLVLGLTALVLTDYIVESNRESGYGRFDIALFPKSTHKQGIIIECKVAQTETELPEKAKDALRQINDKGYDAAFEKRGISRVLHYGMAFCGKKIQVLLHMT